MAAPLRSDRAQGAAPPAANARKVRVMVIDDSLTVRTVFSRMIEREDDLDVAAQAETAEKALSILRTMAVDVILLDLEMPGMGGLDALPKILETAKSAQVLVVSSLTQDGAKATLTALSVGAADTMLKPRPGGFTNDYRANLLGKIRALAGKEKNFNCGSILPLKPLSSLRMKTPKVVAIGASTGGIHALNLFLHEVPRRFDLPILITQHLPSSFIPVFARQVEMASGRETVLAEEGTPIEPGKIIVAPGHGHMVVRKLGSRAVTGLTYDPAASGCMPSVDPMFATLARAYDGHVAGVLLSGMGRDGTEGAESIIAAGGAIFAQDEASCAVWGMPRAVTERGLAIAALPPGELAQKLVAMAGAQAWA